MYHSAETGKHSLAVPHRAKTELPHNPVIPLLAIYPREMKMYIHAKT